MSQTASNFLQNQLNSTRWNSKFRTGKNTFNPGVDSETKEKVNNLIQSGDYQQAYNFLHNHCNLHTDYTAMNLYHLALKGLGRHEQAIEVGEEAYYLSLFNQYKTLVNLASDYVECGQYLGLRI